MLNSVEALLAAKYFIFKAKKTQYNTIIEITYWWNKVLDQLINLQ